jgi:hypothetical protein
MRLGEEGGGGSDAEAIVFTLLNTNFVAATLKQKFVRIRKEHACADVC